MDLFLTIYFVYISSEKKKSILEFLMESEEHAQIPKTFQEKQNNKRLIVVIDNASIESVKEY